jgi:nucleotide-binding universal stress UspA family protein
MSDDNIESNTKETDVRIGFLGFKRILVAYDGMEMSKRALSYAAYFSKVSNSEIVLINIVKTAGGLNKLLPLAINANLEGKKEEEQLHIAGSQQGMSLDKSLWKVVEQMITACKAAGLTKKIIYEIRTGDPADQIIDVSSMMDFDLIIMGSRRIASRIQVIGSTTRKVLTKVRRPILIVQKQLTYKDEY